MTDWYPLRFKPVFKRYLWGGRRLGTVLQKAIGPEDDYAESWEISDHPSGQSVVADGALAGKTLAELIRDEGADLLGRHYPQSRFPLLFKFLDCRRVLSVQVHPNDEQGARLVPPDLGKTEAWIVLDAEPGAKVYAGLKRGFDRSALEREVQRGTTELCLHCFEPRVGDCIFIPAGTIHALGAGLLVAEIQQASDTTYRLFDWNRVGSDGKERPLHIEQSLDVTDFAAGPVDPVTPRPTESAHVQRLVECDKFRVDRRIFVERDQIDSHGEFHLLAVLEGEVDVQGDSTGRPLIAGETILIPAAIAHTALNPRRRAVVLDISIP